MQVGTEVVASGWDSWRSVVAQSSAHGTSAEPMALQDARGLGAGIGLSAAPRESRGTGLGQGCRIGAGLQGQCKGAGSMLGCRSSAGMQEQHRMQDQCSAESTGRASPAPSHGRSCRFRRGWQLWDKVQPWQRGEDRAGPHRMQRVPESFVTSVDS